MTTDSFVQYLIARGMFPALGAAVLVGFWSMGVFRAGYLEAGPRRRVRVPRVFWLSGLVMALVSPVFGAVSGAAVFVVLVAAWPGAARHTGLIDPSGLRSVGIGLALSVPAALLAFGANALAGNIGLVVGDPAPTIGHEMLTRLREDPSLAMLATVVGLAVVVAPLLEEMSYRGLLQTLLGDRLLRTYRWGIVLLVGLLFSLAHLPWVTWHALPGLFALGVVFGAAYERTGSIWVPVVAHAAFNAANIAIALTIAGP